MRKIFLICITFLLSKNQFGQSPNDSLSVSPNPCDTITLIHFNISQTDTISLNVYSSVGATIKTFFSNTVLPNGSYSLNYNTASIPSGIYFIRLKINSILKSVKLLINHPPVGITENCLNYISKIYPNPTNGSLYLESTEPELKDIQFTIINSMGDIVLNKPYKEGIDLSFLPNGIYYLRVKNKGGFYKIVKE